MSNVLKFPKGSPVEPPAVDMAAIKAKMPSGASVKTVLSFAWMLVRLPLFFVMYWLRLPVTLICNVVSIPALFAFLFCWYAFPIPKMMWGLGLLSFFAFMITWTYDFVLMMLSPQPMMRNL